MPQRGTPVHSSDFMALVLRVLIMSQCWGSSSSEAKDKSQAAPESLLRLSILARVRFAVFAFSPACLVENDFPI